MSKTNIWIGLAVVVVLGAGVWFFMNNSAAPQPNTSMDAVPQLPTPENSAVLPASETASVSAKEFTIAGENYSFLPATITVKKGDTVKITLKNAGGFHDFKIDEFNVATQRLNDGEQETVQFIADKAGAFEYYCSVGNHRAMGMKGTLTVTE